MILERRASRTLASLAGVMFCAHAGTAQAELRAQVDASARVGYSSNPFLSTASDTGSGEVDFTVRPSATWIDELGSLTLDGNYRRTQYFRRYDATDAYGVELRGNRRVSETLVANAAVSYDSSIIGSGRLVNGDLTGGGVISDGNGGVIVVPDPGNGDIGLIGQRQRRQYLQGSTGLTYTPTARDSFTAGSYVAQSRYPGRVGLDSDFISYGGNLGYSRAISETTRIGVRGSVTQTDYRNSDSRSRIYQPELTYSMRLAHGWSINAALGASFTERRFTGIKNSSTGLSGQLGACRNGARTIFCANAFRTNSATGLGGPSTQTGVSASYSYRLDELSTVRANIAYSRSKQGFQNLLTFAREYLDAGASYERRLSERFRLTASAGYRDSYGGSLKPKADMSGMIGVAYILGDLR